MIIYQNLFFVYHLQLENQKLFSLSKLNDAACRQMFNISPFKAYKQKAAKVVAKKESLFRPAEFASSTLERRVPNHFALSS
jgi:hypothetical protein